jgi:hypothetical protein
MMAAVAAFLFFIGRSTAATILCALTATIGILALVAPGTLQTLQEVGTRVGIAVGTGLGLGLLTLVYCSVFVAGAVWLRIRHIDLLNRSFPSHGESNWIDRVDYGTDKRLYAKQYTRPHARHIRSGPQ